MITGIWKNKGIICGILSRYVYSQHFLDMYTHNTILTTHTITLKLREVGWVFLYFAMGNSFGTFKEKTKNCTCICFSKVLENFTHHLASRLIKTRPKSIRKHLRSFWHASLKNAAATSLLIQLSCITISILSYKLCRQIQILHPSSWRYNSRTSVASLSFSRASGYEHKAYWKKLHTVVFSNKIRGCVR